MRHISEVIREFVSNHPQLSKRLKLCEACQRYYDVKAGHECELTAAQLAEYKERVGAVSSASLVERKD